MRYAVVLLLFASTANAGTFDYEAEAALALAAAKVKPLALAQPTVCAHCGPACTCQNCGCDDFHKKAGTVNSGTSFQSAAGGCANGQCSQPQRTFRLFPR